MEDRKNRGMTPASHEIRRHTEKEASTVSTIKLLHLFFKALFFCTPDCITTKPRGAQSGQLTFTHQASLPGLSKRCFSVCLSIGVKDERFDQVAIWSTLVLSQEITLSGFRHHSSEQIKYIILI